MEAIARGEVVSHLTAQYDTEDDADLAHWRSVRERVGPFALVDAVLWAVLERWDFADAQGWVNLLAEDADAMTDELRSMLVRFAESSTRSTLAAAMELHRNVEFVADLNELDSLPVPITVRGVIDFFYRNADGWHILAVDCGRVLENDPWHGRRPGLIVQAWAASRQFGGRPVSIALFDLATGKRVQLDPEELSIAAAAEHFLRCLNSARD